MPDSDVRRAYDLLNSEFSGPQIKEVSEREGAKLIIYDDEYAEATVAAASNAKLTPAAPGWATVEGSRALEDLFSAIAQGGDVEELAAKTDEQMDSQLNG